MCGALWCPWRGEPSVFDPTQIDPEAARAALNHEIDSITLVLTEARLTWNDVIEMTSWHTDMAELSIFQQVRDRYVVEPWPAWTAVGTTGLALPDARAEVRIRVAAGRRGAERAASG